MNAFAEFTASLSNNVALLLVVMPVAGALLVRLMSRTGNEPVYFTALTNVWLCCGLVALAVVQFESREDFNSMFRPQMLTVLEWPGGGSPGLDRGSPVVVAPSGLEEINGGSSAGVGQFPSPRISMAINGLNLWLVALTVAATAASVRGIDVGREFLASRLSWLLLTEGALIGTLVAQDLILLSSFNLLAIIGLFFLIGFSNHPDRRTAARRFFRVQFSGALLLTVGLVGAAVSHWWMMLAAEVAVPISFSINHVVARIPDLAETTETGRAHWNVVSPWLFVLICGACLMRIPLPPLHHWWLRTVERADRGTASLMACGFLPAGLYLVGRIIVPLFPERLADLSERLMIWALVAAGLLAIAGLKLAQDWRKTQLTTGSGTQAFPADLAARLLALALVVSLSIAFGAFVVANPLMIRGGLLIAVSAAASAGLSFWLLPGEDGALRSPKPRGRALPFFKWLAVCGVVAMPVSGTFWGLLMAAQGFLRLNAPVTLLLISVLILFAGSVLRSVDWRVLSCTTKDQPIPIPPGVIGLLPLSLVVIIAAVSPQLICGSAAESESDDLVLRNVLTEPGAGGRFVLDGARPRGEVQDLETLVPMRQVQGREQRMSDDSSAEFQKVPKVRHNESPGGDPISGKPFGV